MDSFLRAYFWTFRFRRITSQQFLTFLNER